MEINHAAEEVIKEEVTGETEPKILRLKPEDVKVEVVKNKNGGQDVIVHILKPLETYSKAQEIK